MNLRARLFLWSLAQRSRVRRVADAVFVGCWLGVLRRPDLDYLDDQFYVGAVREDPIDYASPEYNRTGLFEWEAAALRGWFPAAGRLGVLGAGGGREVLGLLQLGFDVEGFECQPAFVDAANELLVEEGFEPVVHLAPRDTLPEAVRDYDGFIVGWGSYTLMHGRAARIAFLSTVRQHMEPGAPILLSFFPRRASALPFRLIAGVANLLRAARRVERVEVGDHLRPHLVHYFSQRELVAELWEAGFRVVAYAERPYGHAVARVTDGAAFAGQLPTRETTSRLRG